MTSMDNSVVASSPSNNLMRIPSHGFAARSSSVFEKELPDYGVPDCCWCFSRLITCGFFCCCTTGEVIFDDNKKTLIVGPQHLDPGY
mmetsp:Transcript_27096/g.37555  ORF Transcript_27096/g.37555 Transcript_27096/m.37555 type:complete len:87 (+) Transcript_27096:61-321(+)